MKETISTETTEIVPTTVDPDVLPTISEQSLETRLLDCYSRNVLFTAGETSTGNTVGLSSKVLLNFYTQPLERLIAPFTHTFTTSKAVKTSYTATVSSKTDDKIEVNLVANGDTKSITFVKRSIGVWQGTSELDISDAVYKRLSSKAVDGKPLGKVSVTTEPAIKYSYRVKLHKLSDSTVNVKFIPDDMTKDVFYAVLTHDIDRDIWNVECYSDSSYSEKLMELPYDLASFQTVPNKALSHGANLPLIRMYRAGLDESGQVDESRVMISNQNLFSIIMTYIRQRMNKALVKQVHDGTQFKTTRIDLPESTNKFIAQLFFTQLMSDSDADLYSLKDYFEKFMSVNWQLLSSHADMTVIGENTDTSNQPAQLAGSDIFSNDTF